MTWRVRKDTENELIILRGLVDELSIMMEEWAQAADSQVQMPRRKMMEKYNESVQRTIWIHNNDYDKDGDPVWWPRHISVEQPQGVVETHLIEERLDNDKNVIESRTLHVY